MIHQGHCRPSELAAHSGDRGTVPVVNRRDPRAPRRAPIADVAVRAGGSLLTHGGGPGVSICGDAGQALTGRLSALGRAVGCVNIEERSGRPTSEKKSGRERKKALAKTWGVRPDHRSKPPPRAGAVKVGRRSAHQTHSGDSRPRLDCPEHGGSINPSGQAGPPAPHRCRFRSQTLNDLARKPIKLRDPAHVVASKSVDPRAEPASVGRRQHGMPKSDRCGIVTSAG